MITALVGENDVARQQELSQIVDAFIKEHGDMAVEKIDGEEASYEAIMSAVQGMSFLASKKLVLLRHPGACKEFVEHFEDFVHEATDGNEIIIVESKLDKRSAYYKGLKKLPNFREFLVLDANGLARFACEVAKEQGVELSMNDARYLVDRVGLNQLIVKNEVEKLALGGVAIKKDLINSLTEPTPQSTVFDLLEAAFAGDRVRTIKLYEEQKALKVEAQQIVAMLAWQLHILLLVKTAKSRSADDIAKEAKVSPYVVRKSQTLARGISYADLKELVKTLRTLDERTKTDGTLPEEAVQYFLLRLATI